MSHPSQPFAALPTPEHVLTIERAYAKAFPGTRAQELCDGWLLRAGEDITERSNSAVPLTPAAFPFDRAREFYRDHDLPVRVLIPDHVRLIPAPWYNTPWQRLPEIAVLVLDLATWNPAGTQSLGEVMAKPDEQWLSMYHFRGQPLPAGSLKNTHIDGVQGFAKIAGPTSPDRLAPDGVRAVTRAVITEAGGFRWLNFSAVEVAEPFRRQGLGTALGKTVLSWGAEHGADFAYLQVKTDNLAGLALYRSLGFIRHHSHRYFELAV